MEMTPAISERSITAEEQQEIQIERKIIKESWIRFEVEKYSDAIEEIKILVEDQNGYISQEKEAEE